MTTQPSGERPPYKEDPPPILGTWPRMYAVVIGWIVVLISLFYWFTKAWNR